MKYKVRFSLAAPLILALLLGCKSDSPTGPGANVAVMSGQVTQQSSATVIAGATVSLTIHGQVYSVTSDAAGMYTVNADFPDTLDAIGSVTVSAGGYVSVTRNVTLKPGTIKTENFQLALSSTPVPPPPPGGGYANTLAYVELTDLSLAVFGVGGTESAVLTFEARDSLGQPIQPARTDTIMFSISGIPVTGGAYITPTSSLTNTSARASTIIQSGTVAGVIQLVASLRRDTDGVIIRSSPVRVLIHGGLPDQMHFGIGANPFNVAGYYKIGQTSTITTIVGDKYGNPVAPGTAVYFGNPEQGVITTSTGYTDASGFASVTLFTGVNHSPNGLGLVHAETIGENGVRVRDSLTILFSGNAIVNITSGSPTVDNTTQATVTFNVWDERMNPLAAGTGITAEIKGASATVSDASPTNILEDVISPFWTSFSIVVSKNLEASPVVTGPFTLTITASGPNGKGSATISGTVN